MHRYLRAVGFSKVHKREEYEALAQFTAECYQSEETTVTAEGEEFSERRKAFADQMGLLARGVYDEMMNITWITVFRIFRKDGTVL